ncbi:hypothetical protein [Sporomusa aerivorans]|uniref:hypothetical protein n=1 Tax=Sporomusa aerivorans TaxID=204936 RepID=UPI00352A6F7B
MSVLFLEKLGVYCLEAATEDEICEQIVAISSTLRPAAEKIAENDLMLELDLLINFMIKKQNSIERTAL